MLLDKYNFAVVDGHAVKASEQERLRSSKSVWYVGRSESAAAAPQFVVLRADGSYVCTYVGYFVNELETRAFAESISTSLAAQEPRTARTSCGR